MAHDLLQCGAQRLLYVLITSEIHLDPRTHDSCLTEWHSHVTKQKKNKDETTRSNKEGGDHPTIIPTPTDAWAPALSPSERFSVSERPRSAVSEDKRFISSPVLVLSKKAVSCFRIEENKVVRKRFTILCPVRNRRQSSTAYKTLHTPAI